MSKKPTETKPPKTVEIEIIVYDVLPYNYDKSTLSQEFEWFVLYYSERMKNHFEINSEVSIPFHVEIKEDTAREWNKLSESQKQLLMYWFNELIYEKARRRLGV